jgi:hypothetical protein
MVPLFFMPPSVMAKVFWVPLRLMVELASICPLGMAKCKNLPGRLICLKLTSVVEVKGV